jgi:hypothetical protein
MSAMTIATAVGSPVELRVMWFGRTVSGSGSCPLPRRLTNTYAAHIAIAPWAKSTMPPLRYLSTSPRPRIEYVAPEPRPRSRKRM